MKRHTQVLRPVYKNAAKGGLRRATARRLVGTVEGGLAAFSGYMCYLSFITASPPLIVATTAATCLTGGQSIGQFGRANRVAKVARLRGQEAVYLFARQDPTLTHELKPGTIKYFDHHLSRKGRDLATTIQRLQRQQAGIANALNPPSVEP